MLQNLKALLTVLSPYWSQLAVIGTVFVAGLKVITDRLNKRDELQFGELLKVRNTEVKAYSHALSEAFAKLNMLTVVINDNKDEMRKLRNEFLEVYNGLVKAYLTLHFFIPSRDEEALEKFHDKIIEVVNAAITLLSRYVDNRIHSIQEFEKELKVFVAKRSSVGDALDEVTPAVQHMIRSYNGIERKWYKVL